MTLMCDVLVWGGFGGEWNTFIVPRCECVLMQRVVAHTYMHAHTRLSRNFRGHFQDKEYFETLKHALPIFARQLCSRSASW